MAVACEESAIRDTAEVDPGEVQAIDQTATAWLIEAAQGTRFYLPIFMTTSAGLRRGEILAAVWSNIDEHLGTLRIDRALSEKEKGVFFERPRASAPARSRSPHCCSKP